MKATLLGLGLLVFSASAMARPCSIANERFCAVDASNAEYRFDVHYPNLSACGIRFYTDSNFNFTRLEAVLKEVDVLLRDGSIFQTLPQTLTVVNNTIHSTVGKNTLYIGEFTLRTKSGEPLQKVLDRHLKPEDGEKQVNLVVVPVRCAKH